MTSVIAFYVISAVILLGGFLAVTSLKIFRSAVWLLTSLTGIAALYFWLDLQFLAAVQIIVYIGGIVVLIIFSIFLTANTGADLPRAIGWRKASSALIVLAGFIVVIGIIYKTSFVESTAPLTYSVADFGRKMLNTGEGGFALPFEVVSILLLAAMIGCIAIAIKKNQSQA